MAKLACLLCCLIVCFAFSQGSPIDPAISRQTRGDCTAVSGDYFEAWGCRKCSYCKEGGMICRECSCSSLSGTLAFHKTVWLVTFLATVFLDVDLGLLIGLIYNLVPILLRTQEPYCGLLGRLPDTDIYVDLKVYREAHPVPGIKIFKFEAPLYFANMDNFKAALIKETGVNPMYLRQLKAQMKDSDMTLRHEEVCLATSDAWPNEACDSHDHGPPLSNRVFPPNCETYAIIIDGSAIQYVDSVTVRVLKEIVVEYREVDIEVFLGECKAPVRRMLDKSGFYNHVYRRNVCATIHHAVQVAQKSAAMSRETLASSYTMDPEDFLKEGEFVKLDLDASVESVDRIITEQETK